MIGIRGEGGIGKSTLMAKVFAESLGFAGKFWADVRTGTSITALAERALPELGVPLEQVRSIEEKDLIPRLLRQLQQGRYLLAIDNLETILTASGEWQSGYEMFLDGFQELGSESVLLLGSREYPPRYFGWRQSRWLTLDHGLEPIEGAALLAALEVEDTDDQRSAVSRQVQGNPLALALIAGWLRQEYRPGERTIAPLQQHSDLFQLTGKHRGETQISVDRVLQWSLDRLSPAQQHLLTQISVLRGAFNFIAAATLALEQSVNDDALHDLERRSLLQELPGRGKDGLKLYRLQPRIQNYVQKQATDLTAAHERAITYFWNHRQTEFAREDTQDAVSHYEETFYHQCQLGRYQDAFATVWACDKFLRRRGYYQLLVDLYSQLHTDWHPSPEQRQTYAAVCGNLGVAYTSLGQYQQAIDFHQQSLEIKRDIGDRGGEAGSIGNLGVAYTSLGQYQRAIDFHQQSLEIERDIGDRGGEAASLGNLGNAYYSLGQYQRAIDFHQQSLEIKRDIGDRGGEAASLGSLGLAYYSLGQYQRAIDFHQQSLEIEREIGDRWGEGASLFNMGNALARLDQHYEALQSYQQALAIYEELKLDHIVEKCQTAIAERNRIIAMQRRTAPTIGPENRNNEDWWERSLPTEQRPASRPARQPRQGWQQWGLWFVVGVAIVLVIWWLQR
jgi:tetratricopeptide (TPR) repeat protein